MVCLFCKSACHKSKKCDTYYTEEERKKRPNSSRFCFSCLKESDFAHLPRNKKCKSNENCIAWYSTYHHKLYCKERVKALAPSLFLPKIVQDLLPRFFKHIDIDEKHLMLVSSPSANFPFNHIIVMDSYDIDPILTCTKSDLVVYPSSLEVWGSKSAPWKKLFSLIKTKNVILPSKISVCDSALSPSMVLQLLSSNTKSFHMSECPSKLSFSDIIKNAPNLERIYIYDWNTNITYEDTWIKDLITYKNGKNFESLTVRLDKTDFDVEDLVEFIKEKCDRSVDIQIMFTQSLLQEDDGNYQLFNYLEKRIAQYFEYQIVSEDYDNGRLWIGYDGVDGYETFSLGKIKEPVRAVTPPPQYLKLKKKRAATKRKYTS